MRLRFHQTNIAVGSTVDLMIVADEAEKATLEGVFAKLWHYIFAFEKKFSRFLPSSELSQFNLAAGTNMQVTDEFREFLVETKRMVDQTQGIFNPFILPALQRAGYNHSIVPGYEHDEQHDFSKLHVAEPSLLKISENYISIPHGTALDSGGCGKGFLGDRLAEIASKEGISNYWFSVGGDIVGSGRNEDGAPWITEVQETPDDFGDPDWVVRPSQSNFAIATSGTSPKNTDGNKWHDIIDPRTQLPTTTDLSLVTIYGTSAIEADVYASTAIIFGSSEAVKFLKGKPRLKGYLLSGQSEAGVNIDIAFGDAFRRPSKMKEAVSV